MAITKVDVEAVAEAFGDGVKNQDAAAWPACTTRTRSSWHRTCPRARGVPPFKLRCRCFSMRERGRSNSRRSKSATREPSPLIWRFTLGIEPPGSALVTDKGKYIVVHETRPGGTTKILYDIFNSDLPAHG